MAGDDVRLTKQGGVATITLNRPESRNALTPEMVGDLGEAIRSCRSAEVRAVIITGAGGFFCSGADVKDFRDQFEQGGAEALRQHLERLAGACITTLFFKSGVWRSPSSQAFTASLLEQGSA